MSDPLEHKDITGVTSTSRHARVRWRDGSPDYYLVADSGNDIFPVQLQIEKTENGSFWAYANGALLGHSTGIEGVKDTCEAHHQKWFVET